MSGYRSRLMGWMLEAQGLQDYVTAQGMYITVDEEKPGLSGGMMKFQVSYPANLSEAVIDDMKDLLDRGIGLVDEGTINETIRADDADGFNSISRYMHFLSAVLEKIYYRKEDGTWEARRLDEPELLERTNRSYAHFQNYLGRLQMFGLEDSMNPYTGELNELIFAAHDPVTPPAELFGKYVEVMSKGLEGNLGIISRRQGEVEKVQKIMADRMGELSSEHEDLESVRKATRMADEVWRKL